MTAVQITADVYRMSDEGVDGLVMRHYCALCRWNGTDGEGPCPHKALVFPEPYYHECAWRGCHELTTGTLCEAHAVQAAEMDSDSHDALDMAYAASRGMA